MGDRNNPIKFGPEWLRNLARERSAGSAAASGQNAASSTSSTSATSASASGGPTNTSSSNINSNNPSKILLANLRYGREEMLALYDRTSEAPPELKFIEMLYQPRGKPPLALNNTFEDDMRDTMRSGPSIGVVSPGERFGAGRGMGRGMSTPEARGKARTPFVRQTSTGRGVTSWHSGSPRMPGYNNGGDEDSSAPLRSWNNNSNGGNSTSRSGGDQNEWNQNKMYRSKRPGSNTNWRQPSREDDDWRPQDNNRSRSTQDKWERDWGDRTNQEKPQSWSSNRRTWVGGDTANEENLPEWAVDGAGACGGTFDSSGAFHGYSNDDTNLPKSQESGYALTRSHTHGSFVRSKTAEEGSEEWWASEKAKKLSPKRFDASDIKFKKTNSVIPDLNSGTSSNASSSNATKEESPTNKEPETSEPHATQGHTDGNSANNPDDNFSKKSVRFTESKTFDALMRSDINLEEASDERGNFQSVMITPNNSLRQKHQNIVTAANNMRGQNRKPGILQMLHGSQSGGQNSENEPQTLRGPEDKIVDDIMELTLDDREILTKLPTDMLSSAGTSSVKSTMVNSVSQMNAPPMQLRMSSPVHLPQGRSMIPTSNIPTAGVQTVGLQSSGLQNVGITNSALNASLGLPLGPPNNSMGQSMGHQGMGQSMTQSMAQSMTQSMAQSMTQSLAQSMTQSMAQNMGQTIGQGMGQGMGQNINQTMAQNMGQNLAGIPLPGVPPPMLPGQGMGNPGVSPASLAAGGQGIPGFPSGGIAGMSGANVVNSSLFLGQSNNNSTLQSPGDMQMKHASQTSMFPMHGLQHSGSQAAFNTSIYNNLMQQSQPANPPNLQNLVDQWYYEDPKKDIQGPFSSKEMYSWYRAGFFSPSLMVRRACDAMMRPLGSYGPVVPFAQMDMMSPFPLGGGYEPRAQGPHETMLNTQQGLGLDVESLWSQPPPEPDLLWVQQAMTARNEARVNNLPMFFWDQQPSAIASNALLPEEIAKEMKTEDQILAQLRASQNMGGPPKLPFMSEPPPPPPPGKPDDVFPGVNVTPNLEELHKLIQEDTLKDVPLPTADKKEDGEAQLIAEKEQQAAAEALAAKVAAQNKAAAEKTAKQTKENEKANKNKENNITKSKNSKKTKEDKKDEFDAKKEEDNSKAEKRSDETSPTKNKKEDKINKKEIEKEKKEWIKEGFTIVKTEKNNKDNKKKLEEIKALEEAERKRREEERVIAEEEKKKRQAEALRKQQEMQLQQQQQRQAESVAKKAPWSVGNQALAATNREGLTLAEIQRLEREKKLEQMKEQQQMMQIIAQQQAAALAREQEMQAGLGWAKKKNKMNIQGQSLTEIQAEARKQAATLAATSAFEEAPPLPAPSINHMPWGNSHNGGMNAGGFWDSPPSQPPKPIEPPKQLAAESKAKKKPAAAAAAIAVKKEVTPAAEFDTWCAATLTSWSSNIDVPTFVGFLKDIESPYEVKDYVKCYLGDSKDSNDFARQFLERRSKLLRVGMVTPSDDLCSPAMAINPRTISGSDYQEVKSKKKTKKKMMKVDANILGFSVTAAEDRINVGDIDTV